MTDLQKLIAELIAYYDEHNLAMPAELRRILEKIESEAKE